jgi:hypothetical protein
MGPSRCNGPALAKPSWIGSGPPRFGRINVRNPVADRSALSENGKPKGDIMEIKHPSDYPVIMDRAGIKVYALPDFLYFVEVEDWDRSCYVRFICGFTWIEPFLAVNYNTMVENAILAHELKGIK